MLTIEGIFPGSIIASLPNSDLFTRLKFVLPFIVAQQDTYRFIQEREALDILEDIITQPDRSVEEMHRFASTHSIVTKNYSLFNKEAENYLPARMYSSITISMCDTKILNICISRIDSQIHHVEKAFTCPEDTQILDDLKGKQYKFNFLRNKFTEQDLSLEDIDKWKQDWFQLCRDFANDKTSN